MGTNTKIEMTAPAASAPEFYVNGTQIASSSVDFVVLFLRGGHFGDGGTLEPRHVPVLSLRIAAEFAVLLHRALGEQIDAHESQHGPIPKPKVHQP